MFGLFVCSQNFPTVNASDVEGIDALSEAPMHGAKKLQFLSGWNF